MRPIFLSKGLTFTIHFYIIDNMLTADQLLLKIVNDTSLTIEDYIPKRDCRVLRSMATAIQGPNFITENQSRLLLKILKENREKLESADSTVSAILENPAWSKIFRQVDKTKKFYIGNFEHEQVLVIEFAFSSAIRKGLVSPNLKISGLVQATNGRLYYADLTEKNIVVLVELLSQLDFEIDEKIQDFYKTIKSWSENEVKNQFKIDTIAHPNFQKHLIEDLGISTAIGQNIINDRSMRYQYFFEKTEKNPENLTEKIANRTTTRVWVDKKKFTLEDIFNSLFELKRFPVLVVFDPYDNKKCLEDLQVLSESMENSRIYDDVGIYFRLNNDEVGKEFNQLIANKNYNSQLTKDTKVVGVANGKIPKFLLKTNWKPMSVISIGKSLQNNKTSVYANCCDLNVAWADDEPIITNERLWLN